MGIEYIRVCTGGYTVNFLGTTGWYDSGKLLGYYCTHYNDDSESGRLLKRAEFLKAVCEKEGVEFLPKEKCGCTCHGFWCKVRSCNACPCHKKPEGSTLKSVVAYRLCTCNDIQKHDILETCPDCMGIRKSSRILNDL